MESVAKVPKAGVEVKVQQEECARFLVAALRVVVVTAAMAAPAAALVVEQEVNRWGLMVQMGNQGLLQTFCSRDYKIGGSRCYRRLV